AGFAGMQFPHPEGRKRAGLGSDPPFASPALFPGPLSPQGRSSVPCVSSFFARPFGLQGAPLARLPLRLLSPLVRLALPREPPPRLYVSRREQLARRLE